MSVTSLSQKLSFNSEISRKIQNSDTSFSENFFEFFRNSRYFQPTMTPVFQEKKLVRSYLLFRKISECFLNFGKFITIPIFKNLKPVYSVIFRFSKLFGMAPRCLKALFFRCPGSGPGTLGSRVLHQKISILEQQFSDSKKYEKNRKNIYFDQKCHFLKTAPSAR